MAAKVKGLDGAKIYYEKDVDHSGVVVGMVAPKGSGHLVPRTDAGPIGGARAGVMRR